MKKPPPQPEPKNDARGFCPPPAVMKKPKRVKCRPLFVPSERDQSRVWFG